MVQIQNIFPFLLDSRRILAWTNLVQLIIERFPYRIDPEDDSSSSTNWIINLGLMVKKEGDRVHLSMNPDHEDVIRLSSARMHEL